MVTLNQIRKTTHEVVDTGGRNAEGSGMNWLEPSSIVIYPDGAVQVDCINDSGSRWSVGHFFTVPGLVAERTEIPYV